MSKPVLTAAEKARRAIARRMASLVVPQCTRLIHAPTPKAKPASGVFGSL